MLPVSSSHPPPVPESDSHGSNGPAGRALRQHVWAGEGGEATVGEGGEWRRAGREAETHTSHAW